MSRKHTSRLCVSRKLHFERMEPKHMLTSFTNSQQIYVPVQDISFSGSNADDGNQLIINSAKPPSESHLTFNVVGFAQEPIHYAKLRLKAVSDAFYADLDVHRGASTTWSERHVTTATAPVAQVILDNYSGSISAGDWIELDVTEAILGDGLINFILTGNTSEEEIFFSSREGRYAPELVVISETADVEGDVDLDNDVDGNDFLAWQRALGTSDNYADINHDNRIDASDLALLKDHYGTQKEPVSAISVTDCGAVPNDLTNDYFAIQACLDDHASIYFPSGEYVLDWRLNVPAGRRLFGPTEGDPAILRVRFDTGISSGNYALNLDGDGITIQNLVIDKDFIDGSYGTGIHGEGRDYITVDGVEIQDYGVRYGIHLIESEVFEISNVYIHDFMMNVGGANAPDMILDSPAGIRITRSSDGSIRDSLVRDIEVGPLGRASISELVPSYGQQTYQSDAITLSESSDVTIKNNNLWNSGELVDLVVSDNIDVRDNTMQMAYFLGVKVTGTSDSVVKDNYISDAAIGLFLGDHSSGGQATGNLISNNDFVNNGSSGIWNESAQGRYPITISGVYVDSDADGNTISYNNIYDYYDYLPQFIREGNGNNTFSNNNAITNEFSPAGGGDAKIVGDWAVGLNHSSDSIELNRALLFYTFAEDSDDDVATNSVTYGGQSLTKIDERLVTTDSSSVYVSAWILLQDALNMAGNGNFSVSWNASVDSVAYASAFLANIYQPAPVFSQDTGPATSGNILNTSPRPTSAGDLVIYGATSANSGSFTPLQGFTESLEVTIPNADAVVGFKAATGVNEFASTTHTSLGSGVIHMVTLSRNPAALLAAPISSVEYRLIYAYNPGSLATKTGEAEQKISIDFHSPQSEVTQVFPRASSKPLDSRTMSSELSSERDSGSASANQHSDIRLFRAAVEDLDLYYSIYQ